MASETPTTLQVSGPDAKIKDESPPGVDKATAEALLQEERRLRGEGGSTAAPSPAVMEGTLKQLDAEGQSQQKRSNEADY